MFGLGKKRSEFGRWLDRNGISQIEIAKKAKLSNQSISKYCSGESVPKISSWVKIQKVLRNMGYEYEYRDFFDM